MPPLNPAPATPTRLRADVEYDGTNFLGFQVQATGRTVQGVLEEALATLTPRSRLVAAGRTDSGVHASGQVIHFNYAGPVPSERLAAVWNRRLPPDVAVRGCRPAGPDFRARYSALARTYRYRFLLRAEARSPLRERYAWRPEGPLDLAALAAGADLLVGTHSFRHFGSIPGSPEQQRRSRERHGWRRTVFASGLTEEPDGFAVTVEADAFLTHMMRALVGALVALGRGRLSPTALGELLEDDRSDAPSAPLAPPHGLCLVRVRYPADET